MFFATLKTVAGQVLMLYLISLIGFVTDKLGVFRQADAKRVIDLLFNIVLPIAIIYTFMTMAYTPDHVRGILLAFVCAFGHPPGGRRAGTAVLSPPQSHGAGRVPLRYAVLQRQLFGAAFGSGGDWLGGRVLLLRLCGCF